MKVTGKDGYLYGVKFLAAIAGGAGVTVPESGWYKIKSKAAANSGIPGSDPAVERGLALKAGKFYWAKKGQPLNEGDALIPMKIKKLSFTNDVSNSAQGQVFDVTTQIDVETGTRAFVPSVFKDRSGTINGQVDADSDEQRELVNEFSEVTVDNGETVTVKPAKSGTHHFMLSRRETTNEGEWEVWEYFPVVIESFQMDKPIEGVCPFNFNYKIDGTHNPGTYYRLVTDETETEEGGGESEPEENGGGE
jgi:plastocyanin